MKTIAQEIISLHQERYSLAARIRAPHSCPRLALEAEAALEVVNAKIADLLAKAEDAAPTPANIVPIKQP